MAITRFRWRNKRMVYFPSDSNLPSPPPPPPHPPQKNICLAQHFYCLMNTWHESLASCSAPQENHYTVANLFPPRDLPSPSATAANCDEHDDDDVGDEAFVWRGAGMDRSNGAVEDRRESWGNGHHGGFGDVSAWEEGVGGKKAQIKPPGHCNYDYDVQVERDYDYRGKNGGEGGCGGQRFLRDEFHS